MFTTDIVAGSWPALLDRLHREQTLACWSSREPAIAHLAGLDPSFRLNDIGDAEADEVLGALIRLAAADGGDDERALLLLLHLLSGTVSAVAKRLRDLFSDPVAAVISEITIQVRSFPVTGGTALFPLHRRRQAWVGNLRAEIRRALLAQAKPYARIHGQAVPAEALVGLGNAPLLEERAPWEAVDVDLVDLLSCAVRWGVAAADVALLVEVETARDVHAWQGADRRVAEERGVSLRTLYRHRERALRQVRGAAATYLAAVA